jgi:thiamine pyrophosphokinase
MDFGAISHQDMVFYFFTKPFHFGVPLFPGDGVQRRRHMKKVVFVVSGGELGDPTFLREQAATKTPAAVICADGGARHVEAAGIIPVLIVGDMDSLDAQRQAYYEAKGCRIVCHPRRKDETDTELALHEAFRMEPAEIWIWGALGHRVDHVLANIFLLVQGKQKGIEVKLIDVSLFPFWGPAAGITLTGFEFPLTNAVMEIGRPYGVSNRLMAGRGIIELGSGCLLAVRYFRPGIFPGEATE